MAPGARLSRVEFGHGLVIGKFYPPHRGHEYLIETAARHCRRVTVGVLGSSVESLPLAARVGWLSERFAGAKQVRVVGEIDDVPVDYADPAIWQAHIDIMRRAVRQADARYGAAPAVDAVFTSEDYGARMAGYFDAVHVCLDRTRHLYPISGTAVRRDLPGHWEWLSPPVRAGLCLRVVAVGAESSGTSTLARDLTRALRGRGGAWAATRRVDEYGREYSANLLALARARRPDARPEDLDWREEDFTHIAAEQNRREDEAAREGGPVLVCDTDALATCIWHERYRGRPSTAVERVAVAMPPRALYLLTDHADVPFEDDGLRDGEHLRSWMTARFADVLAAGTVPWLKLSGTRVERLKAALDAIDAAAARAWAFALPLEQRTST